MDILTYLLLLIISAFILGVIFKYFKQPPVIGYLLSGVFLSFILPHSETHETVTFLSELGVMLLLFTLGLEFSFTRLKKMAHPVVTAAILQILLTILFGTLLTSAFGFSYQASLFMAAAFSLSSTALVVKILTDRGEMDSLPGEILVTWLIVQDLAVLPLMLLLPVLLGSSEGNVYGQVLFKTLESIMIVGLAFWGGKIIIPKLLGKIASLNSRELLLISVFGVAVAGAKGVAILDLSPAIGAFLAGFLISGSLHTHAVFSEIRPLRDLFSLLFFATLGLLIPASFLIENIGQILILTLVVMCIKFIVALSVILLFGQHPKTSLLVGVGLIEIGEFAFVLASVGLTQRFIDNEIYGMTIAVGIISILLMPPLYLATPSFYKKARNLSKEKFPTLYFWFFGHLEHKDTLEELPLSNHVVLCGYGRVGKYIGRALKMSEIPFIVVEYSGDKAKELREDGIDVVYGDPSDIDILDYAQVDKARAVVVAIPDYHTQKQIIENSLKLNKKVEIYCRTHHEDDQKILKELGVTSVIQPEFEASLSIVNKILKAFGVKESELEGKVTRLKIEHGLG